MKRVLFGLGAGLCVLLAGCAAYGVPKVWGEKVYRGVVFAERSERKLKTDLYDPTKHYNEVRDKFIGIGP